MPDAIGAPWSASSRRAEVGARVGLLVSAFASSWRSSQIAWRDTRAAVRFGTGRPATRPSRRASTWRPTSSGAGSGPRSTRRCSMPSSRRTFTERWPGSRNPTSHRSRSTARSGSVWSPASRNRAASSAATGDVHWYERPVR
jgi:hypothetical protein